MGREWVEKGRGRVGHDQHVTFLDLLETTDRRPIKADALAHCIGIDCAWRDGKMLPGAWQIRETQIDHLHVLGLNGFEDIVTRGAI